MILLTLSSELTAHDALVLNSSFFRLVNLLWRHMEWPVYTGLSELTLMPNLREDVGQFVTYARQTQEAQGCTEMLQYMGFSVQVCETDDEGRLYLNRPREHLGFCLSEM